MSTSSVSKGCFVFKPSAKKRKIGEEEHFRRGCEERDGSALRYKLFKELWDQIICETESLQDELNKKILDSLLDFAKRRCGGEKPCDWAAQMRASEIPTAALMLGVNMPDHDGTFQSLSELLRLSVTPYVASLQAKECRLLKHIMKHVLERIVGGDVAVDEEEDEEQGTKEGDSLPIQRGVQCSMSMLRDWYQGKTKKTQDQTPPVVIIFQDLEAFNPKVLQDFIVICSRYIQDLPLVFVFGIATSPSTVQNMLPHSVSSLLCVELFHSLSCTQHLSTVIDKFILTPSFPFRLSGKVMQVLISIFLYHDFSVRNFVKGMHLALLEHFHSQPLSVLCCDKKVALDLAGHLGQKDLDRIRELPSFKRHLEQQEKQKQEDLLTDDACLRAESKKLIKSLHRYHKNYFPILRCLHALTSSLPRYPLGKQIRELHLICLESSVWESQDYATAMKLLRMLSRDELEAGLQRCTDLLKREAKSKAMTRVLGQFEELLSRMKAVDLSHVPPAPEPESGLTSPVRNLGKKTDLFQLQKTLLEMNETRRKKRLSPFEVLRNETVDLVEALVKSHLSPPETRPLNEVMYYRSSATVRRHLNATPRTSIQTALSDPYLYLRNDKLRAEDGGVSNCAPDICVVHKLHLECGRLINLFDWLEAYCTVASAAEGADPGEESGTADELRHARFIRAVSELEFLGFVKSTKQKTDHVARLTWGGC